MRIKIKNKNLYYLCEALKERQKEFSRKPKFRKKTLSEGKYMLSDLYMEFVK